MTASLPPLVTEWVEKAEADYRGALALRRLRRDPVPDLVCYHAQQCAEKYLKALLVFYGMLAPRSHDLGAMATQLAALLPKVIRLHGDCAALTQYGVEMRYPGQSASAAEARTAIAAMRPVRRFGRRVLGLMR